MGKIEVEFPVEGHKEHTHDEHSQIPFGTVEGLCIAQIGNAICGAAVDVNAFPN